MGVAWSPWRSVATARPPSRVARTGSARLWDARSGENRGIYAEAGRRVSAVVGFSPDGKTVLTGVFAGAVRLGDLEARHPREQPSVDVNTVAFSRDGKTARRGTATAPQFSGM